MIAMDLIHADNLTPDQVMLGDLIKVYNVNSSGKYSLAVGRIEAFPFNEQIKAFLAMPELKSKFFGKNPFTAYFNRIGFFFLIFLLVILLIIYGIILLVRKIMKNIL